LGIGVRIYGRGQQPVLHCRNEQHGYNEHGYH
jgi:hypothetical protein